MATNLEIYVCRWPERSIAPMFSKSAEYERIMALIPGTDPEMLDRFLGGQQISPTTARIWAEQGLLTVCRGQLCHIAPPFMDVEFACPDCYWPDLVFSPNGVYCPDCGWVGDDSQVIAYTPAIGPLTLEETYG